MSEIAEQTQNPVLPEPPVAQVPTQSPELQTPEPDGSDQNEAALTTQINQLWRLHTDYAASMRSQSQNLRSLRAELGKKLADMKQVLARPGRGGEWSGWLREQKIPRATADRLVLKHERSLHPDGNRLTEAISEPTDEEIKTLLDKIAPKLRKALRTPASAYRFLDLLSSSLAALRKDTDEGFVLVEPSTHEAVEQSVPEEAQVDPVPVIADIPAEGDSESMGTPLAL